MKLPPSTMMGPLHATELVTSVIGVPSSPSAVFVPMSVTLSMTMPLLPSVDALATIARLVADARFVGLGEGSAPDAHLGGCHFICHRGAHHAGHGDRGESRDE